MKSHAKRFVSEYPNTKIVRVSKALFPWSEPNECWQNAQHYKSVFNAKMVAGWVVMDGSQSNQPVKPKYFAVRHFWNKLNGRYVDSTPLVGTNNYTYVLNKAFTEGDDWITLNTEHVRYNYENLTD